MDRDKAKRVARIAGAMAQMRRKVPPTAYSKFPTVLTGKNGQAVKAKD